MHFGCYRSDTTEYRVYIVLDLGPLYTWTQKPLYPKLVWIPYTCVNLRSNPILDLTRMTQLIFVASLLYNLQMYIIILSTSLNTKLRFEISGIQRLVVSSKIFGYFKDCELLSVCNYCHLPSDFSSSFNHP